MFRLTSESAVSETPTGGRYSGGRERNVRAGAAGEMTHWRERKDAIFAGRTSDASKSW